MSFSYSKGIQAYSVVGVIVGTIIGLLAITAGFTMVATGLGGNTEAQQDYREIGGLVEAAEAQCEAAIDSDSSLDDSRYQLSVNKALSMEITEQNGANVLYVDFPTQEPRGWTLRECNYELDFSGDLTESRLYGFTISVSQADTPTVTIEGSAQ